MGEFTLDDYRNFLVNSGQYTNELDVEIGYKLFLALETLDPKEVEKAMTNAFYNYYYKSSGKFN